MEGVLGQALMRWFAVVKEIYTHGVAFVSPTVIGVGFLGFEFRQCDNTRNFGFPFFRGGLTLLYEAVFNVV